MISLNVLLTTLLLLVISIGFPNGARAEDPPPVSTAVAPATFVDLDGDGFDDNMTDQDGDGIPEATSSQSTSSAKATVDPGGMFGSLELVVSKRPAFLRNSGSFGYARGRSLSLVQHRGGFGSGSAFGPGNDIGSGAVLGGACAGGVCIPH